MLMARQMRPPFSFWSYPKRERAAPGVREKGALAATLHMRAKLLYGGGARGYLRVCEGPPTGAAGCGADLAADSRGVVRLGLEDTGAFEPLLFSCLALRRSPYFRHQCSTGSSFRAFRLPAPTGLVAFVTLARANTQVGPYKMRKADGISVGADAFISPLRQFPRGTASGSEKRSNSMR